MLKEKKIVNVYFNFLICLICTICLVYSMLYSICLIFYPVPPLSPTAPTLAPNQTAKTFGTAIGGPGAYHFLHISFLFPVPCTEKNYNKNHDIYLPSYLNTYSPQKNKKIKNKKKVK